MEKICMEKICTRCHAVVNDQTQSDWRPACGGALTGREPLQASSDAPRDVVDHRGIVLPRRHAVGGVITPV